MHNPAKIPGEAEKVADIIENLVRQIRLLSTAMNPDIEPPELEVCDACGCLCTPYERCPGCAAQRIAAVA